MKGEIIKNKTNISLVTDEQFQALYPLAEKYMWHVSMGMTLAKKKNGIVKD